MSSDSDNNTLSYDQIILISTHEIRQPLIDIRNSLDRFRYNPKRFPLDKVHSIISDAAELALLNVEIITALSRPMPELAKAIDVSRIDIDLEEFLHSIRKMLRSLCDGTNFKSDSIRIEVCSRFRSVRISKPIIGMIAMNTMSNSIKYSTGNFHQSWCSVKVESSSMRIIPRQLLSKEENPAQPIFLMTVSDNGIGIPQDKLTKVFEQGIQLDETYASRGAGMGLFTLRRIVHALGGWIWIESYPKSSQGKRGISTRVFVAFPEDAVI